MNWCSAVLFNNKLNFGSSVIRAWFTKNVGRRRVQRQAEFQQADLLTKKTHRSCVQAIWSLILWAVYLLFISFPINAIIFLIQTDLQTHKHKRWDLLHEPIIADHNQSSPIIPRWRHCLLSRDFPPFILNYSNFFSHPILWGDTASLASSVETPPIFIYCNFITIVRFESYSRGEKVMT